MAKSGYVARHPTVKAVWGTRHRRMLMASLLLAPFVCIVTGNMTGGAIWTAYQAVKDRGPKDSHTELLTDENGVPINDYGYKGGVYIGKRRNPTYTALKTLEYSMDYERARGLMYMFPAPPGQDVSTKEAYKNLIVHCADWMVTNMVVHGDYAILQHDFPWPQFHMTPPWRSGMAQGLAAQALTRAHRITGDRTYLDAATLLLRALTVEASNGGVTYKSDEGWWYEEYAGEGGVEPRVLNGMMYALLGVHEYYEFTRDPLAKMLFDEGIKALTKALPRYANEAGGSNYDSLGDPAPEAYHQIHVMQLDELYDIVGDERLRLYRDQWRDKPYVFSPEPPFLSHLLNRPTKIGFVVVLANVLAVWMALEAMAAVGMFIRGQFRRSL
jgi:hypothetical protein